MDAALKLYALHARVVDVVGSDKHERFEVQRLNDEQMEVVVYKTRAEGDIVMEIYRRVFFRSETEEVRLYGQDGDDTFVVTGAVNQGIRVRAIGGGGEDTFIDESQVGGPGNLTVFYDTRSGESTWETGAETRIVRSPDPLVNRYDPGSFKYDVRLPQVFFGANQDDGVFVGGGLKWVQHGFRKEPYARAHRLVANVASKTLAFNVVYGAHFVDVLGRWDVRLDAHYRSPSNIRNYYGLGNETRPVEADAEFYQARLTRGLLMPSLQHAVPDVASIRIGTGVEFVNVREDEDRFVGQAPIQEGVAGTTFDLQWFGVARMDVEVEHLEDTLNPKQGYQWHGTTQLNVGLDSETYTTLASELAMYLSPSLSPQVTFALRVGGAHNLGKFPFYGANTLGESDNLRGYRSTRFAGRSSFYQNVELRTRLFYFSTYVAIGEFGLLGFLDNGRVWTDGEHSTVWHQGYGGGVWTSLFDTVVITGTVGFSKEDTAFSLRFGFLY